jgi:hypothetical protein
VGVVRLLGLAVRGLGVMVVPLGVLMLMLVLVLRIALAVALLRIRLRIALDLRIALLRVPLSVRGLLVRALGVTSRLRILLAVLRRVLGGGLVRGIRSGGRAVRRRGGGILRGVRRCAVLCVVRSGLRLVALVALMRVSGGVLGVHLVVSAYIETEMSRNVSNRYFVCAA